MRLIFSRKGFDSESGGVPSPILPNGTPLSLPIPDVLGVKTYSDMSLQEPLAPRADMASLVEDLTKRRVQRERIAHIDPDLHHAALPRRAGWRGAFGQVEAALGHLDNQGVTTGDVFLFFGWFRDVVQIDGRWTFTGQACGRHVIFGWLQVGERIEVRPGQERSILQKHPWLTDHPHMHAPAGMFAGKNVIFIASPSLTLPGVSCEGIPGAGVFRRTSVDSVLTATGAAKRSHWRLPIWTASDSLRPPLSYHAKPSRWSVVEGDAAYLRTVGRGQEFVLNCVDRPQASGWVRDLVLQCS